MSIVIMRGPEAAMPLVRGPQPLPRAVIRQLVACAGDAGKTVALRAVVRNRNCWMRCVWPVRRGWRLR